MFASLICDVDRHRIMPSSFTSCLLETRPSSLKEASVLTREGFAQTPFVILTAAFVLSALARSSHDWDC